MSVSRDEFDRLVDRVDRIERTVNATVEIVASEVVGLRSRLDSVDQRLDSVDHKLDQYTEQVQIAIRHGSDAAARHERFARAIADHFGIELDTT